MTTYEKLQQELPDSPRRWLVTGVAGFIGSHLLEQLLRLGQTVTGLDNFATGRRQNLDLVRAAVGDPAWARFRFVEGDITSVETCRDACRDVELVLHQAALGSVPRSIVDPARSYESNVMGFLTILTAARDARVKRFVYASSSSVYGTHPGLPKKEDAIGHPLSPYAATKYFGEVTAGVFQRCYGLESIGLRYFNVFGPRQDPNGPYAAVVPKWIAAMLAGGSVQINGDGETSRDFCYVANVVQANLLAATTATSNAANQIYNVALNDRVSLNRLFAVMRDELASRHPELAQLEPTYRDFRAGDVRHSQADVQKAVELLGYSPTHSFEEGLAQTVAWHFQRG